jgi:membrane protease YdiL (CAAX protease family)
MRKEIKIAAFILIGFLAFLLLEKPLREYVSTIVWDERTSNLISSISIRLILIAVALVLMKRLGLFDFTGLNNWQRVKNMQAVILALAFIIMGASGNWNTYIHTEFGILFLFFCSTLVVGVVEEFVFRGTIFPLFIKSFTTQKRTLLISAILSSLMFGLVHFVNLFKQPENMIGITSQVFFATAIGVFFCGLMVRTENILIPCIIHALVNFSFSTGKLKTPIEEFSDVQETSGVDWSSFIPTTLFFLFIFIGGVYMILQADQENILDKLEKGKTEKPGANHT